MTTSLNELHSRAWRLFLTAHAKIVELIEQDLAAAELPPLSWYDVLWTLEKAPDHRQRLHELAQEVLLSRSNMTRLIDRLEAAGLLCRERCPSDRRGAFAVLTADGLAMRKRMWTVYARAIETYFAKHLSDSEASVLTDTLERLVTNAKIPV